MRKATQRLVEYLALDKSSRHVDVVKGLANVVLRCGDKADADILVGSYLSNLRDFHFSYLLGVFKKFGDYEIAERLFNGCIVDGRLGENSDGEILEVFGHLNFEPIKPVLIYYAFNDADADYYVVRSAILGLLHFDCADIESLIQAEIEKCYGKNLFSEFVPALVSKLSERTEILEKLYELGSTTASTDCNAGIVLAFSLCGAEGEAYFRKILFDPLWETGASATGTVYFTFDGMVNLGITFRELYQEIRLMEDSEQKEYALCVFTALLEVLSYQVEYKGNGSFKEIFVTLFKWKNANESDNLEHLVSKSGLKDDVHRIMKLLELRMEMAMLEHELY